MAPEREERVHPVSFVQLPLDLPCCGVVHDGPDTDRSVSVGPSQQAFDCGVRFLMQESQTANINKSHECLTHNELWITRFPIKRQIATVRKSPVGKKCCYCGRIALVIESHSGHGPSTIHPIRNPINRQISNRLCRRDDSNSDTNSNSDWIG